MRRTPIVLGGTVAGLFGVLTFHTRPGVSSLPAASSGAASPGAAAAAPAATPARTTGQSAGGVSAGASAQPASSRSSASSATGERTAAGSQVNFDFGVLSVKVTVSGKKIVKIGIASLDDGGNPRSQHIDEQAIPMLEQEAMHAQSASIQGVSGASYTSDGFVRSLQSALSKLGVK